MQTGTISAAGQVSLPSDGNTLATRIIHLRSNSFSGSITVKGRARGSYGKFPTTFDFAYVAIPYRKRYLNGAVGDDSFVSTAITDTSIIEVNTFGLHVVLDCTAFTSGSMDYVAEEAVG